MAFQSSQSRFSLDQFLSLTCFYEILGISNCKTGRAEIRKAYLRQSKLVHPDKQKTPEDRVKATKAFVKLKEAYDTLHDPVKRASYDDSRQKKGARRRRKEESRRQKDDTKRRNEAAGQDKNRKQKENHRRQEQDQKRQEWQRWHQTWEEKQRRQREQEEIRRRKEDLLRRQQQEALRREREKLRRRQHEQQQREEQWQNREEERRDKGRRAKQSSSQRTFGVTASGEPCKRCIHQGGYCFQHDSQDPLNRKARRNGPSTATSATKSHDPYRGVRHFGLNKNGVPCKDCIKKAGYCFRHSNQDPRCGGCSSNRPQPTPMHVPFGRRKDGQSCKDCEKKGDFCWRHVNQRV